MPKLRDALPGAVTTCNPCETFDRYSPFLVASFRLYLRWYFWRKFHSVRLSRTGLPPTETDRPIVIYCNHPSWWDPAVFVLALPKVMPGRRGFAPMDAVELQRYALFRRMGIFGIDLHTTGGAATFLKTSQRVLQDPHSCLCVTAEGAFTDPRLRPVRLRPGLAHLAKLCPEALFLPLALEYGFWNESKPEALLRFGAPVRPAAENTVASWQATLQAGLTDTMDALAAESATRNSAKFVELFGGTAGVGGIYDVWRRARAALGGPRFTAEHETTPP